MDGLVIGRLHVGTYTRLWATSDLLFSGLFSR
jgi:hypothetical protein